MTARAASDWLAAPPPLAALDRGPRPARLGNILVGTASWTEKTLLASRAFYPRAASTPERRLRYYAHHFPVVEVDATYYALGVKAYAALTGHPIQPMRLARDVQAELPRELRAKRNVYPRELPPAVLEEIWKRFGAALEPVRAAGKLAYLLFQMPKWFAPSRESHAYLESLPSRLAGARVAVEFRQAGWMTDERRDRTLDFLRRHGLVYVSVDEPQGTPSSVPPIAPATTEEIAVVRFHGRNQAAWDKPGASTTERFGYLYRPAELREWVPRIHALSRRTRQVHVLMNNCYREYAVQNAKDLAELLTDSG